MVLMRRSDFQSNVPTETVIITATRAPIGMRATQSPKSRRKASRNTPAQNVESRPRPPDCTLVGTQRTVLGGRRCTGLFALVALDHSCRAFEDVSRASRDEAPAPTTRRKSAPRSIAKSVRGSWAIVSAIRRKSACPGEVLIGA
jgi:hypothetical protein